MRLAASALSFLLCAVVHAAPGDFDPAFGESGRATVGFLKGNDNLFEMNRLQDGKYLLGEADEAGVARLLQLMPDGTRDASFGNNGIAEMFFARASAEGFPPTAIPRMARDSMGRIVVAIPFLPIGIAEIRVALYRWLPDGTPDMSFGEAGHSEIGVFSTTAIAMAIDASRRIWVAGTVDRMGESQQAIARITESGLNDVTFGTDGFVYLRLNPPALVSPAKLVFDASQRLVFGGTSVNNFTFARLLQDGSLDPAFNGGAARFMFPANTTSNFVTDVALDAQGRIVGSGIVRRVIGVSRVLPDGTPDASFGNNGNFIEFQSDEFYSASSPRVAFDSTGRILIGAATGRVPGFCSVTRLLESGSLDTSYAAGGRLDIRMNNHFTSDGCFPLEVLPDDSIAIAGRADGTPLTTDVALARVTAAGTLDTSFNAGRGYVRHDIADRFATGTAVIALAGGQTLVGGAAVLTDEQTGDWTPVVVKLTSAGTLDTAYGNGGVQVLNAAQTDDVVAGMVPDAAGRTVIGLGNISTALCSSCRAGAVRLNPDGGLDGSFASGGFYRAADGAASRTRAAASDPRGYVLLAEEQLTDPNGTFENTKIRVERLNADGTLDPSFGAGGRLFLPLVVPNTNRASAMTMDSANRTLIAGARVSGTTVDSPFLWRLTAEGTPDSSFGSGGAVFPISSGGVQMKEITGIAVDPAGRIYVTGPASGDFVVARLLPGGALDTTFGSGGIARPAQTANIEEARSVALFQDGIVLGGWAAYGKKYFALIRVDAAGNGLEGFGPGGLRLYDFTPRDDSANAMAVQADGNIVLAGTARSRIAVMRALGSAPAAATRFDFDSSGRPDVVFRHSTSGDTFVWRMNGLALQSDQFLGNIDPSWRMAGHGDFNGDGKNDIVWRNTTDGTAYIWYLNDGVLVSDAFLFTIDPVWMIEAVDDFDGDGHPDFLFRHQSSGLAFIWYYNDTTPVRDQFLFSIDNSWIVENTGDFDNDGYPDFFFRNTSSGLGFVWYWDGSSLGASNFLFSIDPAWQVVQIVDWNHDGNVDLLFRNADTGVTFVWYTNGTSLQGSDYLFQIDPVWEIVPYR